MDEELEDERRAHDETRAALQRAISALIRSQEIIEDALNSMTCAGEGR